MVSVLKNSNTLNQIKCKFEDTNIIFPWLKLFRISLLKQRCYTEIVYIRPKHSVLLKWKCKSFNSTSTLKPHQQKCVFIQRLTRSTKQTLNPTDSSFAHLPSCRHTLVWLVCWRSVERDNYYSHRAALISWVHLLVFIMFHSPLWALLAQPPGLDGAGGGAWSPRCPFTLG